MLLQSISDRNKSLLNDKKKLLIQNKLEIDRMEKEQVTLLFLLLTNVCNIIDLSPILLVS